MRTHEIGEHPEEGDPTAIERSEPRSSSSGLTVLGALKLLHVHTGCASRFPARAPGSEIARLVDAILPELENFSEDLSLVFGTEGVPADISVDAPLLARLRDAFPRRRIVYRARAAGLNHGSLGRLSDAGVTTFELDVANSGGGDLGASLAKAMTQLGLSTEGVRSLGGGLRGMGIVSRARLDRGEIDVQVLARAPWPSEDRFQRWHPCGAPGTEVALWTDGSLFLCGEQCPSLSDVPQGNWRESGIAGALLSPDAAAFRASHANPASPLPRPCVLCPHPAEPWALGERERLLAFRDRHRGERCFILGNGPSLGDLDLTRLRGEVTFGVNRIHEAYGKLGLPPVTYYCVSDPTIWRLAGRTAEPARASQVFVRLPDIQDPTPGTIHLVQRDYDLFMDAGWFPLDPAQGLVRGLTVLLDLCVPLAYWMGFDEVILLGCDFSFDPERDNHFYGDKDEPWPHSVAKRAHRPPVQRQLDGMRVAARAFERAGRRLVNATPGGGLTVLERRRFDDLFQNG